MELFTGNLDCRVFWNLGLAKFGNGYQVVGLGIGGWMWILTESGRYYMDFCKFDLRL